MLHLVVFLEIARLVLLWVLWGLSAPLTSDDIGELVGERHGGVLVTSDESLIHGLEGCAFPLEAGEWHEFPLFEKEVSSVLARHADQL